VRAMKKAVNQKAIKSLAMFQAQLGKQIHADIFKSCYSRWRL
jgi:hypothetical protein